MSRPRYIPNALMLALVCALATVCAHATGLTSSSLLDSGYRDMYNLQFGQAHQSFAAWEHEHPQDPLGPASDAAAYLFSEFNRLHVLEFEFFTNDNNLSNQPRLSPDPVVRQAFEGQLAKTQQLADAACSAIRMMPMRCLPRPCAWDYAAITLL